MAGLAGCSSDEREPNRTLANPVETNWSQKFDSVRNDASVRSCSVASGLETIWERQLANEWVTAAPILFENRIYVGTGAGTVLALDARSGRTVWERQFSGIQAALGVADERLVVPAQDGNLYGLELDSGKTVWSISVDGPAVNPVTVVDGTLFVTTLRGQLYAIEAESGTDEWQQELGDRTIAKPAVWNDFTFVPATGASHTVYALNRYDGTVVWERTFEKSVNRSTRVSAGSVYAFGSRENVIETSSGRQSGSVFEFDAEDGTLSRTLTPRSTLLRGNGCDIQSVAVSEGVVYLSACNGVFSFDGQGRQNWHLEVENGVATDLLACENSLLFADFDGVIHRVLRTGDSSQLTSKTRSNPSTPCVLGETMVLCSDQSIALLKSGAR